MSDILSHNLKEALQEIPLFPLPQVVFFPKTILPLHVFEDRYRTLVADALEGHQIIGVPLLKPGFEADYENKPEVFTVFGIGEITQSSHLDDGRYNVVLTGLGKVRLNEELHSIKKYRTASVSLIPDQPEDKSLHGAAMGRLREQFIPLLPFYEKLPEEFRQALSLVKDPELYCHLAIMHLVEDPLDRQAMLELGSLSQRYHILEKWIASVSLRNLTSEIQ